MKLLVTGHNGYIGSVMTSYLQKQGYEVVGLDTYLFDECTLGPKPADVPALRVDLRDVQTEQLKGFDAVFHLAALCNDPLGNLNPGITEDINHQASVRLARLAKEAGIPRYLFASSCSLYGVASDTMLTEDAAFNPITPYGASKVHVEQSVSSLASPDFSPTYLRNATAYGLSPRLRGDVVVNNLVAAAFTTGEVLVQSDGTPWRPLVHVEDICRAFVALLKAPRELVHNQAFNVGQSSENYQVRDLADLVSQVVPGSRVRYAPGGGPDPRCYKVDCSKIATTLPDFKPQWNVRSGMQEIYAALKKYGLTADEFQGTRFQRIKHIQGLMGQGLLDNNLRWTHQAPRSGSGQESGRPARA